MPSSDSLGDIGPPMEEFPRYVRRMPLRFGNLAGYSRRYLGEVYKRIF